MPKIILKINSAADKIHADDNICCYLAEASLPAEVLENCRKTEKMVLLCGTNAAEVCKARGLDGIVIEPNPQKPLKAQIKKEQADAGAKKALGIVIPAHRHEAMLAGETEPDFVAFKFAPENAGPAADVIKWYNELFLIQAAVDLSDGLQDISGIDTDFVIINSRDYEDFGC